MSTFIERMIAERNDLSDKLDKLHAFVEGSTYATLSEAAQIMLGMQQESMAVYYDCLVVRIELAQASLRHTSPPTPVHDPAATFYDSGPRLGPSTVTGTPVAPPLSADPAAFKP